LFFKFINAVADNGSRGERVVRLIFFFECYLFKLITVVADRGKARPLFNISEHVHMLLLVSNVRVNGFAKKKSVTQSDETFCFGTLALYGVGNLEIT